MVPVKYGGADARPHAGATLPGVEDPGARKSLAGLRMIQMACGARTPFLVFIPTAISLKASVPGSC